jgi:phosphonate transport system permease protein
MRESTRARILVDVLAMRSRHSALYSAGRRDMIFLFGLTAVLLAALVFGLLSLNIKWAQVFTGFGKLGDFLYFMLPPSTGTWEKAAVYAYALAETVAIALLGVLVAAILAFPVGFMAAKNVMPSRLFHFLTRRFLDSVRGVDELIWALIWVGVVGLGPFAGVLALICSNFGSFGKLFSEAIEVADKRPIEGVVSTGGNGLQRIGFGIVPQIFPVIAGQVLYFFESNTRSATIIGIVGAGGIGLHLAEQIRMLEYQHVAAIILMILVLVAVIDYISTRLRFAIIGRSEVMH